MKAGFEPGSSDVGSVRSSNCVTSTTTIIVATTKMMSMTVWPWTVFSEVIGTPRLNMKVFDNALLKMITILNVAVLHKLIYKEHLLIAHCTAHYSKLKVRIPLKGLLIHNFTHNFWNPENKSKNKFYHSGVFLQLNNALWLVKNCHLTSFNKSECNISA